MMADHLKHGIRASALGLIIVLVVTVLFLIIGSLVGFLSSEAVIAWLESPVSEMKVWHLLWVLWFIGLVTR